MRVLLVEDTDDVRDSFVMLLELLGCEVRAAPSGFEALEAVAEFSPELVLTDFNMPRMNGAELIFRLRLLPELGRVPIVLITANVSPEAERLAREAGAADVMIKPIDVLDVVERYSASESLAC